VAKQGVTTTAEPLLNHCCLLICGLYNTAVKITVPIETNSQGSINNNNNSTMVLTISKAVITTMLHNKHNNIIAKEDDNNSSIDENDKSKITAALAMQASSAAVSQLTKFHGVMHAHAYARTIHAHEALV
jgi:hypothetical protein